jgi:hypothetical protein
MAHFFKTRIIILFKSSWMFILVLFIGIIFFSHVLKNKKLEIANLQAKLEELHFKKENVIEENSELKCRISCHDDPTWIEQVLIKELGVMPEGKVKVHFTK